MKKLKFKWFFILFLMLVLIFFLLIGLLHYASKRNTYNAEHGRSPHWVKEHSLASMPPGDASSATADANEQSILGKKQGTPQHSPAVVTQDSTWWQSFLHWIMRWDTSSAHYTPDATAPVGQAAAQDRVNSTSSPSSAQANSQTNAVDASNSALHQLGAHTKSVARSRLQQTARSAESGSVAAGVGSSPAAASVASLAATPVRVVEVRVMPMQSYITAVGSLKAQRSVDISSEIAGRITKFYFSSGQKVEQGALLVQLDDSVYKANLAEAQAALLVSQSRYMRYQKLAPSGGVSQIDLQQALSTYKQDKAKVMANKAYLSQTQLRAPFAGNMGDYLLSAGSYVNKGQAITSLVDRSDLMVVYLLPEKYRTQLQLQQPVLVRISEDDHALQPEPSTTDSQTVRGTVVYIAPQVDINTHSVTVQAKIPNPDNQLSPGAFVQVKQQIASDEHALVVPESCILPTLDGMFVFKVEAGKARPVQVQIGARHGRWVQIQGGVHAGDQIVVAGVSNLRDGMPVRVLPGAAAVEAMPVTQGIN